MWSYQSFHRQMSWSAALSKAIERMGGKRSAIPSQTKKCQSAKNQKETTKVVKSSSWEETIKWRKENKKKKLPNHLVKKTHFNVKMHMQKYACNISRAVQRSCSAAGGGPWLTTECLKHPILRLQTCCEAQPKKNQWKKTRWERHV